MLYLSLWGALGLESISSLAYTKEEAFFKDTFSLPIKHHDLNQKSKISSIEIFCDLEQSKLCFEKL